MDSKKADRLLDRIKALHKSLSPLGEGDEISGIERDLMLSYLRQLYELYLHADQSEVTSKPVTPPKITSEPAPPPPVVRPDPPVAPPPPPPSVQAPPSPAPTPPPAPQQATPPVTARTTTTATSTVTPPPVTAPTAKMSKEVAALFTAQEVRELSDRLGLQPIKDLTRSLTINNRVQFANVLFAGNSDLMNSVLKRLNVVGSYQAAQPILAELAAEHDWPEDDKAPVAKDFIKLVNRRYA